MYKDAHTSMKPSSHTTLAHNCHWHLQVLDVGGRPVEQSFDRSNDSDLHDEYEYIYEDDSGDGYEYVYEDEIEGDSAQDEH